MNGALVIGFYSSSPTELALGGPQQVKEADAQINCTDYLTTRLNLLRI